MPELFLGDLVDPVRHERCGPAVRLSSAELTTHGVIVGMTGSGKTGLGIVLLEEALMAGIPVIAIDPKGDLTNLALAFPELRPADFEPWIDPGAHPGRSPTELAAEQAGAWRDGLAGWGITPEQVGAFARSAEVRILTPGSTAGVPVNVVGSLQAPVDRADDELVHDEIDGTVRGLLGLVGIAADPLASPEHILLANLIAEAWRAGRDLDLATLVGQIAKPPLRKLGVFDVDAFFPPPARLQLAMRLNGLLASPAFAAWGQGEALDVDRLLRAADGRPRASIVSVAHLSDVERQFVVSLVLAKLVTWMRRQSGTIDLRVLVYFDEVTGYLPPVENPPTKKPILLLMKQARAFGVGVVLATQNPVDIDYKAISNAGTWMVGRLQTERDKARLLDGMSAAAGGVDVAAVGDTISGLAKREFVLRRAGRDQPEVFTTRWAMCYLRGPLTRDQIAALTPPSAEPAGGTGAESPAPTADGPLGADESPVLPEIAAGVPVRWLDPAAPWASAVGAAVDSRRHVAAVAARVRLRFDDDRADLVHDEEWEAVLCPLDAHPDFDRAVAVDHDDRDLRFEAPPGAVYVLPVAPIATKTFWTGLRRSLVDHLVRSRQVEVLVNSRLKLFGRVGETPESFAHRCREAAERLADEQAAALREKYEVRYRRLQDQLGAAADRARVLEVEHVGRQQDEVVSAAGDLLGAFLGGRRSTRAMARSMSSRRRASASSAARVEAAQRKVGGLEEDLAQLDAELADDLAEIDERWQLLAAEVDVQRVPLERTDVDVVDLVLVWVPMP